MSASESSVADLHAEADAKLRTVLDGVTGADTWDAPSPCDGWEARDVVGHLIGTQTSFLAERAGLEADPTADGLIADELVDDPAAAWRRHVDRIAPLIGDAELMATGFDGWFGPTTIGDAFVQFYVFDMLVHRWDVATALGVEVELTDAELDLIEASVDSWGDSLYMEGICKKIEIDDLDADRETRALALLGRTT